MNALTSPNSDKIDTSTEAIDGHDQCMAYKGEYEMCDGDVAGLYDSLPLCSHHLDKADIYDYPRIK